MAIRSQSLLDSPRGKRLLAVLCAVAFLHFVDASITNVALPHIRLALGFSVQTLQWEQSPGSHPQSESSPAALSSKDPAGAG